MYIMSWLATTDANNLEQTYIQGFLDVSGGNITNRHHNLSILQGTMDVSGAVAFNSRLDVGGDVSLNGTTIDICGNLYAQYPNNSIPLSGLSDVIAGGAEFTDSLLIGSTTTGTLNNAIRNVGIGIGVLNSLTEGDNNVAVGYKTLYSTTTGKQNTAEGYVALYSNTTGNDNTANGCFAGYGNTEGDNNTYIGNNTGYVNTTGDNNTYIGMYADADAGLTGLTGSTAIGYSAKVTASNQIMLGTAAETVVAPGQVDICGNLYAQYDIVTPTIPAGAIIGGVGSNVFDSGDVSMNSSLVVGGDATVNGSLNTGFIALGGHIHPTTNAAYDLGNSEYKIRHLFLSDNSLWIGDDHKVDVSGGKMKFKKRKKDTVPASIAAAGGNAEAAKASKPGADSLSELTLKDWLAYAKSLDVTVGGTATTEISIQDIYGNSTDADYEIIQNADIVDSDLPLKHHLTINPIDVTVDVSGIQHLDQSLKFTIPNSMTALKYFCTSHSGMIGDFTLASLSTETDKTYYVRMVGADPENTAPYFLFSDAPNGTALNDASTQLTLYKGNTYTFITTATTGHPFMVGDSHNVTTGMKLESTGDGAVTESKYTNPYPLHVNGMANIENNLNVARTLTVSGPIRQW